MSAAPILSQRREGVVDDDERALTAFGLGEFTAQREDCLEYVFQVLRFITSNQFVATKDK